MNNTTKVTIRTLANIAAMNRRYARTCSVGGKAHSELMAAYRSFLCAAKIVATDSRF